MITNNITLKPMGDEEVALTGEIKQDNRIILESNFNESLLPNNGFTRERLMRKIASVPLLADYKATKEGVDFSDKGSVYRFLRKEGYLSVSAIDTGHTGHVIVR